jgi:hypothetical protein
MENWNPFFRGGLNIKGRWYEYRPFCGAPIVLSFQSVFPFSREKILVCTCIESVQLFRADPSLQFLFESFVEMGSAVVFS